MWMVADNQICSAVNRSMGQRLLRLIRLCCLLTSPVECCNDQFCALLLRILDIGTKLVFTVIGSIIYKNSDKCNFYTIDLFDGNRISNAVIDPRFLQCSLCISKSLLTVITAVIICKRYNLYRTVCQNLRVIRIALKRILLILPVI